MFSAATDLTQSMVSWLVLHAVCASVRNFTGRAGADQDKTGVVASFIRIRCSSRSAFKIFHWLSLFEFTCLIIRGVLLDETSTRLSVDCTFFSGTYCAVKIKGAVVSEYEVPLVVSTNDNLGITECSIG